MPSKEAADDSNLNQATLAGSTEIKTNEYIYRPVVSFYPAAEDLIQLNVVAPETKNSRSIEALFSYRV